MAGRTVDGRIHPMGHRYRALCRWSRRASEIAIAIKPGTIHSAMAIHTPTHAQILDLADSLHGLDWTVALLTCDSSVYMRTMVEIHEVWQVVDLHPTDRSSLLGGIELHFLVERQRVVDFLYFRRNHSPRLTLLVLCEFVFSTDCSEWRRHESVTIHANVSGGYSGVAALLRSRMAIQTLHLQLASMQAMGESHWLRRLIAQLIAGQGIRVELRHQDQQAEPQCSHKHQRYEWAAEVLQ